MRKFYVGKLVDANGATTNILFGMPAGKAFEREIAAEIDDFAMHYNMRCVEIEDLDTFLGNTFMEVVTI